MTTVKLYDIIAGFYSPARSSAEFSGYHVQLLNSGGRYGAVCLALGAERNEEGVGRYPIILFIGFPAAGGAVTESHGEIFALKFLRQVNTAFGVAPCSSARSPKLDGGSAAGIVYGLDQRLVAGQISVVRYGRLLPYAGGLIDRAALKEAQPNTALGSLNLEIYKLLGDI